MNARGYWLLELVFGGRVYRFADTTVDVTEGDDPALFIEGLGPVEYQWGSASEAMSLEVMGLEVAGRLALITGEAATATLYRYWPGSAPVPVFDGTVGSVSWGVGITEAVTLSLIPATRARVLWPADTLRVSQDTCPITGSGSSYYPDQDALGLLYPVVFGRPGGGGALFWDGTAINVPATPALLAEYGNGRAAYRLSKLIIAGHRVSATSVIVHDRSGGYSRFSPDFLRQSLTVYHTTDRLGQTVAYVSGADTDISNGGIRLVPGNDYQVEWPNGGGITNERGVVLRQAGDIVAYLLARSGVPVDEGGSARALTELNRFTLDFCLTEQIDPVSWVDSVLGDLLGFVVLAGPNGLIVVRHRLDATAQDAIGALEVGRNVERAGKYSLSSADKLANNVVVSFAPSEGREGKRRIVVDATRSALAVLSLDRYGRRDLVVEAPVVYDTPTANAIALDHLVRFALPRVAVTVTGGSELEQLKPGDVVLFSDAEAGFDEEPAVVGVPTWRSSGVTVPLILTQATQAGR